jgi:CRP-like cAMP-binding protein
MNLSAGDSQCDTCEFRENLALLRGIDFFAGLAMEPLKVLAYLCTRQSYREGEPLFSRGDDDGQAFHLLTGEAELLANEAPGPGGAVLRRYAAGAFIGGLTLLGTMPRVFTLRAACPVAALVLNRAKFARVLERFPEVAPRILRNVADRIRAWESGLLKELGNDASFCRRNLGVSLL